MEGGPQGNVSEDDKHDSTTPQIPSSAIVQDELIRILDSPLFAKSPRCKEFLRFVVGRKLSGDEEVLKERTIGVEVFGRRPGYMTGEDPVVRVQASEVRRKLQHFYSAGLTSSKIQIVLPVGSYVPSFQPKDCDVDAGANESALMANKAVSLAPVEGAEHLPTLPQSVATARPKRSFAAWFFLAACCAGAFTAGMVLHTMWSGSQQQNSDLRQFWSPVFVSPHPVLICLAKSVAYRPGAILYDRYTAKHPETFQTEVERSNEPLPLNADEKLLWRDMTLFRDFGVAVGDVRSAVKLSAGLAALGKAGEVRIGEDYSFADIKNSPAVFIGAFNNRWAIDLMSGLHFSYVERHGQPAISENIAGGRVWMTHVDMQQSKLNGKDYALVGRLLTAPTGGFAVVAGGLTATGTEAASDFLTSPSLMAQALSRVPPNWREKNEIFVLEVTVTEGVVGQPKIVSTYSW